MGEYIDEQPVERVAYFFLRAQLALEFTHGNLEGLALCERPGGALDWTPPSSQEVELESEGPEEIEGRTELYQGWQDLIEAGGEDVSDVEQY